MVSTATASRNLTRREYRRRGRWIRLGLAGAVAWAVGLPLLVSLATGSWAIPHNDDWAFIRPATEFAHSGKIELLGWNQTFLVGHLVVLGPFADLAAIRHLYVATAAAVLLLCVYRIVARQAGQTAGLAAAISLAVSAPFALLASSFMTDLPALASTVLCVSLGIRALRTNSLVWMTVAIGVGVFGATIRDVALTGPAVLAVLVLSRARRDRDAFASLALLAGGFWLAVYAAVALWRRSLANSGNPALHWSPGSGIDQGWQGYVTLALFVLPLVVFSTVKIDRLVKADIFVGAAVLAFALFQHETGVAPLLGNYLNPNGAYSDASLGVRNVLPAGTYAIIRWVALLSAILLAVLIRRHWSTLDAGWKIYTGLTAVAVLLPGFLGQLTIDRYALPLVVPFMLLALGSGAGVDVGVEVHRQLERRRRRWAGATCSATIVALAATSTALTLEALSYDAARWRAASQLVDQGVPTTDIDAGLEWEGTHASTPADMTFGSHPDSLHWAIRLFASSRECYLVSAPTSTGASASASAEPIATLQYRKYAFTGTARIDVQRVSPCR